MELRRLEKMKLLVAILLSILASDQYANGYRILSVFPLNGRSHWTPGENLLLRLAERGHQVDVISHFPRKKPVPNYTDISLEGTLPTVINNMNASNVADVERVDLKKMTDMIGTTNCELLGNPILQNIIKNPPTNPPYDLVIVELFLAPCHLAFGRHLKIPMIGVITSTFHDWISERVGHPRNTAFIPHLFSSYSQQMNFWERLMNTVTSALITWNMNYYLDQQTEYVKKHFGIDVEMEELYKDLSLLLVNSHHSTNGVKWLMPSVVEVGGLHIKENSEPLSPEVQKWLDESTHGCVFVTFGSMVRIETYPDEFVKELYKAFESIAPVRVLMKIAKKEDLIPGLPKNVMIQPWFSQMSVLKHNNTKVFVTHGGLLSTQESVYFGVPMVGIPLFGDQQVNLRNSANKKIAVNLGSIKNVTAESLANAIKTVMHDESYRSSMQKVSQLFKERPEKAIDTATYWVEYVAKYGNVLQSPARRLTWWQQHLLDVYAFIAGSLLAALLAIIFVLRKAISWATGCKSCSKRSTAPESKKKK